MIAMSHGEVNCTLKSMLDLKEDIMATSHREINKMLRSVLDFMEENIMAMSHTGFNCQQVHARLKRKHDGYVTHAKIT